MVENGNLDALARDSLLVQLVDLRHHERRIRRDGRLVAYGPSHHNTPAILARQRYVYNIADTEMSNYAAYLLGISALYS